MPLTSLRVEGYRSLREIELPLKQVNVITGANGTGKSNLYQALALVARAAAGEFARAIAEEGGAPSVLWAGGERIRTTRKKPARQFRLAIDTDLFGFSFAVGLPSPNSLPIGSLFRCDPEVKDEKIWIHTGARSVTMLDRRGPSAWLRNAEGAMDEYALTLLRHESALSQIVEPRRYPEIGVVRQALLTWRFYHHFRTDADSPLRRPQIGVYTGTLSPDASDLAAALETILEVGDEAGLRDIVARAFSGARLRIEERDTLFSVSLEAPGLLRPLTAREFSDGQLRFLCLCAALLSPRPPALIALNEPETSLHPDLYDPLAELIARASRNSQIWVTTHSRQLAAQIAARTEITPAELTLIEGETRLAAGPNTPRRPHRVLRFEE